MIRTVLTANNPVLSFPIPASYLGKQVEVIAFAIDEPIKTSRTAKGRTFTSIKVNATDFKFNRDELNER